jgi:hypothetical protein
LVHVVMQATEQSAQCVEASPGRSDHDELVHLT